MRNEEDKVDVIFIPQLIETDLTQFPEDKQKLLEAGHAIIEPMTTSEGREVMAFHQIDFETGQVLSVPTPVIGRNLQLICDHFHLSNAELSCLSNGKPLTVSIDDEPVTMGIDLDDLTGIRVSKGDEQQWRSQPKKEWEKYNFGIYGCWTMDENGKIWTILQRKNIPMRCGTSSTKARYATTSNTQNVTTHGKREILHRRRARRENAKRRVWLAGLCQPPFKGMERRL